MDGENLQQDSTPNQSGNEMKIGEDLQQIYQWLSDLCFNEKRLVALNELSQRRGKIDNLAFLLWHNFGCISALLQEITAIIPPILTESLTAEQSHRACCAVSLIQVMAVDREIKDRILRCELMYYLVPLLKPTSHSPPIEYLRISVLGIMGSILKNGGDSSVCFVLSADILPTILTIMETGSEICKAVSAYILQRILEDVNGLEFVCSRSERFTHVLLTLGKVVMQLALEPSIRILKQVIRCYERLADNPGARVVLIDQIPGELRDSTFFHCLQQDKNTRNSLLELIRKVGFGSLH